MAKDSDDRRPPYVPYTTFTRLIGALSGHGAPPPVLDNSVLTSFSGVDRSQLRSAMKFLALIDQGNATQAPLRDLVKAHGTDKWAAVLKPVVEKAYHPVVGTLDLGNATLTQLNDAFRESTGADGQVKEKAVRFFLTAMRESGVQLSPYFNARGANGGTGTPRRTAPRATRKRPPRSNAVQAAEIPTLPIMPAATNPADVPANCLRVPFPLRDALVLDVLIPKDLTKGEVERLTALFKSYATKD